MSEKQLDFIHIFDAHESSPEIRKEEVVDIDDDDDPVAFDEGEAQKRQEVENVMISREHDEHRADIEKKRTALIKMVSPTLEDFDYFLPEINSYRERMDGFKREYARAVFPEKVTLYEKIVAPEQYDDPAYHDTARLYFKYLEMEKTLQEKQFPRTPVAERSKQFPRSIKKARELDLRHGKNAAARLDD